MLRFITITLALLAVLAVDGAFAFQKCVRLSDSPNTGDSTNSGNAFNSAFYQVDCSKPVQCAVVLGDVNAGNITFSLLGKAVLSGDTWPAGSSYVTLISRTVTSSGRYMLQLSPTQNANSSSTYGLLNSIQLNVASDNADSCKVDAYLIYQTPEQAQ